MEIIFLEIIERILENGEFIEFVKDTPVQDKNGKKGIFKKGTIIRKKEGKVFYTYLEDLEETILKEEYSSERMVA